MATDLKIIFYNIINDNTWMQPKTRKYALKKINNLKIIIGSYSTFVDDYDINYNDNELWQNLLEFTAMKMNQFITLIGQNVINLLPENWSLIHTHYSESEVYMVNSIYKPNANSIYIPLAYIQEPFINLSGLGFEYNIAYFGFTIAHELSHSLDITGCNYDINGNLYNWWSDSDRKKYKHIQNKINLQYYLFSKNNSEMNLSENIADIMGFYMVEKYLIHYYELKQLPNVIIKEKLVDFYIFYAYQMKSIITKYAAKRLSKTNMHSLNEHRVNIPLSRSYYFKTIFNIKKEDNMYYPNVEHIF